MGGAHIVLLCPLSSDASIMNTTVMSGQLIPEALPLGAQDQAYLWPHFTSSPTTGRLADGRNLVVRQDRLAWDN